MIRRTLNRTKESTFGLFVPAGESKSPVLAGTCFFIHPTGFLLSANHVVADEAGREREIVWLQAAPHGDNDWRRMVEGIQTVQRWPDVDLALLKADFAENATKTWLEGRSEFPHLDAGFEAPEDGTPVYSYGYPLQPR